MNCHLEGSINSLLKIPQTRATDLSYLPVPDLAQRFVEYKDEHGTTCPEKSAVEFYLLNHLTGLIKTKFHPEEPLPELEREIVAEYQKVLAQQSTRLFWYLLLIVTRESRHTATSHSMSDAWRTEFGEENWLFYRRIRGQDSEDAVEGFESQPPKSLLGQYLQGIEALFRRGTFKQGFGGKPWENITKCLLQAVMGKTSLEIMVDTAFTLAHNNGPVFNKGMVYQHYSDQILMILDLQRSGQIPEGLLTGAIKASSKHLLLLNKFASKYPGTFRGWVDWYQVVADGSKGSYEHEKNAQKLAGHAPKKMPKAATKPSTKQVQLWPGFTVTTFTRPKKAA